MLDVLFVATTANGVPFKGGVLYTIPVVLVLTLSTDAGGTTWFSVPWPAGLPSGVQVVWQHAIADASTPSGATVSNALVSTTP